MSKEDVPAFTTLYNRVERRVEVDSKWVTSEGLLSPMVDVKLKLSRGELAVSAFGGDRRAIIMGTDFGNIVVHDQDAGLCYCFPPALAPILSGFKPGSLDLFAAIFGGGKHRNIAMSVTRLG